MLNGKLNNGRAELGSLIEAYYQELPGQVFSHLSGVDLRTVRKIKHELGITGSFLRQDRFATTREFPKAPLLTGDERERALQYWRDLRKTYGRT